jgi:hypothetical protein
MYAFGRQSLRNLSLLKLHRVKLRSVSCDY